MISLKRHGSSVADENGNFGRPMSPMRAEPDDTTSVFIFSTTSQREPIVVLVLTSKLCRCCFCLVATAFRI
jgi:hypothetical protein